MLKIMKDLPEGVLGVSAHGNVTADDYRQVLIPAIEERAERLRKLRLLYVFGPEFTAFSAAAAWEDAKVGLAHFTQFERIAVVTDVDWIRHTVRALGFMLPADVRIYDNGALERARTWILEPPRPGSLQFQLDRDRGVLVLEPTDELEAADFDRVAREIDPYIDATGGLAGLVVIADSFPGWDDFSAFASHFRFIRDHRSRVRRVALVTSSRFLAVLPKLAMVFVDAEVRRFESGHKNEAIEWVAAAGE